jgi:hypothetical protein
LGLRRIVSGGKVGVGDESGREGKNIWKEREKQDSSMFRIAIGEE